MIGAARSLGIHTVLIQHGFLGQEWLHWPVGADKVCVWGEVDRRWYVGRGLPEDRIEVTGSPRAFTVDRHYRAEARAKYRISPGHRVVVFLAPNLGSGYHARAAEFLRAAAAGLGSTSRLFVRFHPSQSQGPGAEYDGVKTLSPSAPLKEVVGLADVILHDFSTMAFAEFAGLQTACLALDAPYPAYYSDLMGEQKVLTSVQELCEYLLAIEPCYEPISRPTISMAAGGKEATERMGRVILELTESSV
jgi:hypothetical protein